MHKVKSRGNQVQASRSLYPEKSQMTILVKCCLPGKLIRDLVSGADHLALSAQHIPKVQPPRKKTGIQHKPCGWHKQGGTVGHYEQGMVGTKFPVANQRPTLQVGLFKVAISSLLCSFFSAEPHLEGPSSRHFLFTSGMSFLIPLSIKIPPVLPELPQVFLSPMNPPLIVNVLTSLSSRLQIILKVSLGCTAHEFSGT